jgi:hypothetical protein
MSGDKTQQPARPRSPFHEEPLSDEELASRLGWFMTVERGFFQILREDFLPPFRGRKKKHKRP